MIIDNTPKTLHELRLHWQKLNWILKRFFLFQGGFYFSIMEKRRKVFNAIITSIGVITFIVIIGVRINKIVLTEFYNPADITSLFNVFFFLLALLYLTKHRLNADIYLCYPNSFLLFQNSRYNHFQQEYKNLSLNIPTLLLSLAFFCLIASLGIKELSLQHFLRLLILFLIQFHFLNWFFLLLMNLLKEISINLLSIFLLAHLFTSTYFITKNPIFLLNPIFGWVMIPEIYHFNFTNYVVFLLVVILLILVLARLTKKFIKWNL